MWSNGRGLGCCRGQSGHERGMQMEITTLQGAVSFRNDDAMYESAFVTIQVVCLSQPYKTTKSLKCCTRQGYRAAVKGLS